MALAAVGFAKSGGGGFTAFWWGFGLTFLALAATALGLGLPGLEGFGAAACWGGAAVFVFFFNPWPVGAFFGPPVLEGPLGGLALLGETFGRFFCFEEADLAAGFFLLATLSPSSMEAEYVTEAQFAPLVMGGRAYVNSKYSTRFSKAHAPLWGANIGPLLPRPVPPWHDFFVGLVFVRAKYPQVHSLPPPFRQQAPVEFAPHKSLVRFDFMSNGNRSLGLHGLGCWKL